MEVDDIPTYCHLQQRFCLFVLKTFRLTLTDFTMWLLYSWHEGFKTKDLIRLKNPLCLIRWFIFDNNTTISPSLCYYRVYGFNSGFPIVLTVYLLFTDSFIIFILWSIFHIRTLISNPSESTFVYILSYKTVSYDYITVIFHLISILFDIK